MVQNGLYIRKVRVSDKLPEDSYVSGLPVVLSLKKMGGLEFKKRITFLAGENGVGKSTLIEAIAVSSGFNPEGGTKNFMFSTEDTHSELCRYVTVTRGGIPAKDGFFFRAESFYNAASYVDRIYGGEEMPEFYGGTPLHKQSHGESFLALFSNRFSSEGIYIMDEPEAALSPMRQMELICHIHGLAKRGSQFIISTHSPMLMTIPGADVLEISENGIMSVDYKSTEHFQTMKRFLENPERMLNYLLY